MEAFVVTRFIGLQPGRLVVEHLWPRSLETIEEEK